MFNTDDSQDRYCLFHYIDGEYYSLTGTNIPQRFGIHHLTSYCVRSSKEDDIINIKGNLNVAVNTFTFTDLKERNVTSNMLLSWSASLEIAELYQIFLDNSAESLSTDNLVFYNCTPPWFGPFCQFTPIDTRLTSFSDLISTTFRNKHRVEKGAKVTCYKHLMCQTFLSCLDWREICDGKYDCIDGSDEKDCWELEVSRCNNNEYRCRNGQCIPMEFHFDLKFNPDCLDHTDDHGSITCSDSTKSPTFACEETTCHRKYLDLDFPCGNGKCTNGINRCYNGRSMKVFDDFCSNVASCIYPELRIEIDQNWCSAFCADGKCSENNCSDIFEYRRIVPIFGHIRLMFSRNATTPFQPSYVCYNGTLCLNLFPSTKTINGFTCVSFNESVSDDTLDSFDLTTAIKKIKDKFRTCSSTPETFYCNYSTMYSCQNSSKCISKQRLVDGVQDCPLNDDETFNESCTLPDIHQRFKCKDEAGDRCFALVVAEDSQPNCKYGEDERYSDEPLKSHIYFNVICDGINDLLPIFIDLENETDESNCEHWLCNNSYTRCDGLWSCKNGADEIGCRPSICSRNQHECVFPNDTSKVSCLPMDRAGDEIVDCLGETDERTKYRRLSVDKFVIPFFKCWNDTKYVSFFNLCNRQSDCDFNDDESFCQNFASHPDSLCFEEHINRTDVEDFFCKVAETFYLETRTHFNLKNCLNYPAHITSVQWPTHSLIQKQSNQVTVQRRTFQSTDDSWLCNQGIPIRYRLNSSDTFHTICLCPPTYYGNQCQYQNQRVSLTIQIRAPLDRETPLFFLITLIDDHGNVQSYDYIEYISIRDCVDKFNMYLLYATRPKNLSKVYSVQIDAFNHKMMKYRASWIFSLRHPFLPVHRLAVLLRVPFIDAVPVPNECSLPCVHGQCFRYVNEPKSTYCHCKSGWSSIQCDVQNDNQCASDAFSVSQSICLCPLGRYGPQCHLFQSTCDSDSCLNGGECVPNDQRYTTSKQVKLKCLCLEGYSGDRCADRENSTHIEISFHPKVNIPSMLFLHFINADSSLKMPMRTTTAKKIRFDQNSVTAATSLSFDIAFVQMSKQYYLIIIQNQTISSALISTKVIPSNRCPPINQLFDDTFASQHLLKRIKYYHLPCQQQINLICFHDDVHICLCTLDRRANCFEFNHNMTYDCEGYNHCENNAHCFQDHPTCPKTLFCACDLCSFGSKCQLSTKGSTLFLDTILGYHIRSNTPIHQQPSIIKLSIALTVLILVIGLSNSFLTFQTFRGKESQTVGCGVYLYSSSIVSLMMVVMLTLKFSFFLSSQIGSITNRSFVHVHCTSMDFFVRILLTVNDWLSACVAVERAVNISQGVKFNQTKSKQIAKWIILTVVIAVSCSNIYDPIHRQLIDDEEEQRTWCVTQYSFSIQIFDWILSIFHFLVPFVINCISAVIVILMSARTRSNVQKKKLFKDHLKEQLYQHKHLLISPLVIIVLSIPRVAISFLSGCMKSSRDSWYYLVGYFIPFIPSIMTLVVFVLPSEMYKKELSKSMKGLW